MQIWPACFLYSVERRCCFLSSHTKNCCIQYTFNCFSVLIQRVVLYSLHGLTSFRCRAVFLNLFYSMYKSKCQTQFIGFIITNKRPLTSGTLCSMSPQIPLISFPKFCTFFRFIFCIFVCVFFSSYFFVALLHFVIYSLFTAASGTLTEFLTNSCINIRVCSIHFLKYQPH